MFKRALLAALLLLGSFATASAQPFPNPIVRYAGQHPDMGGIHVDLTVVNWNAYSPAFFMPQPPPCGLNPMPARTWVEIHNAQTNATLNTFCALGAPANLQKIWFWTLPPNKPKAVYVIMWDRKTNKKVKSNIVKIP